MQQCPDLVVLGGGSGGLLAAKRAASYGACVVVCEPDALGGTCVNRGCVPKKMLWQTARHWTERTGLKEATETTIGDLRFDRLMSQIGGHISSLQDTFAAELEEAGITLIRAKGYLTDTQAVRIDDDVLKPGRVLLATGAKPNVIDIPGAGLLSLSDDVFRWTTLPQSLVVVGGGYIGAEFASIFSALGVKVTVVQSGERLLPGFDADAVAVVTDILGRRGVDLRFETTPTAVQAMDNGLTMELSDGVRVEAERMVCAIGRQANLAALGPGAPDMAKGESGALSVSDDFETSRAGVYAIGDVADRLPLTPVATRDGEVFADRAFGDGAEPIQLLHVARAAFTLPAVAQVGDLSGSSWSHETGSLANPILSPCIEPDNLAKTPTRDQALVGAALVGNTAPELIAPLAALVAAQEGSAAPLKDATAIHPSFSEEFVGR
ncbi:NAD(P)/FAD-dependent oxidoreductase [Thalassococcus sp. S3]|uniref:dihydrolipoyl dehydrogenase family protein n=1 Tax=Thalassococcus sp. S3 TaxID=2017482 RepID=UPI001024511B|nr:NAD(P)/FAD-dependent oxidoreductase [Thalassococcus sp. S3]QBF33300.1 pyridine nucleotide-disulfide oxidoreductase [Thalassococcus sp. S3]